jgi:hypothetical protein
VVASGVVGFGGVGGSVLAEARPVAASVVLCAGVTRMGVAAISGVVRVGQRCGFVLDSPAYGGAPRPPNWLSAYAERT